MKLAYPIATPEVRSAILGAKGPLADTLSALRDAGYDGIEPFIADPARFDGEAWARTVERSGLAIVAVGTGPLVFDDALSFTSADATVRATAIERARACVRFAARLGAQLNIGKVRGDVAAANSEQSWSWMRQAFSAVCDEASACGIVVTLEPQGRPTINNLNTTREAVEFVAKLGRPNLKLMLDTFHMDVEKENIAAGVADVAARDLLLHVHFADTSRRGPGEGSIDFRAVVAALRAARYDRAITLEIKQEPDAMSAARRAATYVRGLMSQT